MANRQSSRVYLMNQLVRQHSTTEQLQKREVNFQFSGGRKFYRSRDPYQSAKS